MDTLALLGAIAAIIIITSTNLVNFKLMKDTIKAAMKAALADMGVSQDKYQALEFSVKSLQEIRENDVAICKETTVAIKIVK